MTLEQYLESFYWRDIEDLEDLGGDDDEEDNQPT